MDLEPLRDDYDRVAGTYVDLGVGELDEEPWLRSVLAAFAEQVRGRRPVLDVGCGPGQVSAFLAALGVDVRGSTSRRGWSKRRARLPELRFDVGSATGLDVAEGSSAGVLGWWSLFHLPRPELPGSSRASRGRCGPVGWPWWAFTSVTASSSAPRHAAGCR
jgi:SAM-dependent methyltransferase